jgi:hypothetical protein
VKVEGFRREGSGSGGPGADAYFIKFSEVEVLFSTRVIVEAGPHLKRSPGA